MDCQLLEDGTWSHVWKPTDLSLVRFVQIDSGLGLTNRFTVVREYAEADKPAQLEACERCGLLRIMR